MRVEIRGVIYESVPLAAKALKVHPSTIYCAVTRGNLDRVGMGPDYAARNQRGGLPRKPITVAGKKFASFADLARFLGRKPTNLRRSLRRGDLAKSRIIVAVMRKIDKEKN